MWKAENVGQNMQIDWGKELFFFEPRKKKEGAKEKKNKNKNKNKNKTKTNRSFFLKTIDSYPTTNQRIYTALSSETR